jgi:hypothetical protein
MSHHKAGTALKTHAQPAFQQILDESMVQYNDASGLLVTRHYDFGFKMLV